MAEENFLINPPKRIKRRKIKVRRRNPIGETLVTIGANPMRRMRRGNPDNPWFGDSGGHRIAALMRWGKLPRGRVNRHRKRGKVIRRKTHRVKHRKVSHMARRRRTIDRRTVAYKQSRKKQYSQLKGFLGLTAPGPSRRFRYVSGEGWATTTRRRKNMARHKRRKSRRINTWFGQPRRHRKASKKGWRKGHMLFMGTKRRRRVRHANPMVSVNPRRRKHNVRHRRRNPFGLGGGGMVGKFTGTVMDVRHWAPLAITGGLSAITGAIVPGMLGVYNPWAKYGVQIGVAVGGGMVVERVAGKEHGQAWMIVGMAMVGYSLLKEFVIQPYLPQFAVGLGGYEDYYPTSAYDNADNVSQQVGAFPTGMNAFPSSMNDYPGVGAYPYDGAGY